MIIRLADNPALPSWEARLEWRDFEHRRRNVAHGFDNPLPVIHEFALALSETKAERVAIIMPNDKLFVGCARYLQHADPRKTIEILTDLFRRAR